MATTRAAILCGVDGSADSRAALHVAADLAGRLGLRLVAVYVTRPPQVVPAVPLGMVPVAPSRENAADVHLSDRLLDQIMLDEQLYDAERRVLTGMPAERLADLADDEDAAMIVVGSRGRGAFKAAFLGSVSHQLVGIARCPVLVVPRGVAGLDG